MADEPTPGTPTAQTGQADAVWEEALATLRAAVGHWISDCALCREEVAALAPVIAALHRQVAAVDGLS